MSSFHMSTWNIEGKGSSEDIDKILSSTDRKVTENDDRNPPLFSGHIVCIQQANLPSAGESENYRWLCSGEFGSAVLISKDSPFKTGSFEQICEQICVAEVIIDEGSVLKVISCYIPPHTDYVTGDLWMKLVEVMKSIPSNVTYLLGGDFNAEIGSEDICPTGVDRGVVGRILFHKTSNENGIQLKNLTLNCHGKIMNSFGGPNTIVHTYKNGKEISQRSYLIVPCDRVPVRTSQQECQLVWHPDYKHAALTKYLKPTFYEKLSQVNPAEIVVSSWNVHGASTLAVDKALNELDLPIVCVQDLFLTSDNDVKTENFAWFTSKILWGKNVGILIKTNPDISMADFEVVSEYICVGNVNIRDCMIKVICCCLPLHIDSAMFQEVTAKLNDIVKNVPGEIQFVVAGDFNTHVSIMNRDRNLIFDEGDENAMFLQKLMQEFRLEMTFMHRNAATVATEKSRRNSSHVLMSQSCLIKYFHRRLVRWVPYYECGIVTLNLAENEVGQISYHDNGKSLGMFVDPVDGLKYVTRKVSKLTRIYSMGVVDDQGYCTVPDNAEQKSDLPEEVVAKYRNTPPPVEELLRILGDEFTLYYGFLQESTLPKGCIGVLAASFDFLKRGDLLVECLEIIDPKTEMPSGRLVKFRWNGIIIHQQEGSAPISFTRTISKGQSVLLLNLGQHAFTVKAKRSFYNHGLPPLCRDKNKLKEVIREVKRSEFPPEATVEDVQKFIDDFFKEQTYLELVFGADFSQDKFLEPIKRYAKSKNLGIRWFKSTSSLQNWDNLVVFMDLSPYELRKRLMVAPDHQDLKFHLIPPCGVKNNYFDWINHWAEKILPDANHWEGKVIPEKFYNPNEMKMENDDSISKILLKDKNKTNNSEGDSKQDDGPDVKEIKQEKLVRVRRKIGYAYEEVRQVGDFIYTIKKNGNVYSGNLTIPRERGSKDWMHLARKESDLPMEIIEKYKQTCIPEEELASILGDEFLLYYGFVRDSSVVKGSMEILAESFESAYRGGLMFENIEVYREYLHVKRIIKFKWNGICIHEEEGSAQISFKNTIEVGRVALINKLGRHFYTVRAKKSFYNKGLPPLCDQSKLNEIIRVVKKSDFSLTATSADVNKFIDDCLQENPHMELLFGADFTEKGFVDPIKKYATLKDLGIRVFKSSQDTNRYDNFVVFNKRSPIEIRERLKKLPDKQDLQFFLIPPCEGDQTYPEWTKEWVRIHVPEELVYYKTMNTAPPKPVVPAVVTPVVTPQSMQNQRKEKKRKLEAPPSSSNPFLHHSAGSYSGGDRSVWARETGYQDWYRTPEAKRAKAEVYERPRWQDVAPLIILWPVNIRSENEENPRRVLEANFPTEVSMESENRAAVFVTLPMRNQRSKRFCLCVGNGMYNATTQALDMIVRNSSVIKHTPQYLPPGGRVPEFIQYNIPCQTNPRTYILLSKYETGPLNRANVTEIFHNLKSSFNEDVFFDKKGYSYEEKQMLLDLAPKHDLSVRHFGDDNNLNCRYICVYKTKPKDVILDEVLRMRDHHPKYMLVSNNQPQGSRMGGSNTY